MFCSRVIQGRMNPSNKQTVGLAIASPTIATGAGAIGQLHKTTQKELWDEAEETTAEESFSLQKAAIQSLSCLMRHKMSLLIGDGAIVLPLW